MTSDKKISLEELAAEGSDLGPAKKSGSKGAALNDEILFEDADPTAPAKVEFDDGPVLDDEDVPEHEPIPEAEDGAAPEKSEETKARAAAVKAAKVTRARISGVFSTQTVAKVGTGTTVRKTIQKSYWFAEEKVSGPDEDPVVLVQPLNNKNVPSGPKEEVPLGDFLGRFNPELEFYQKEVFPKMKEMNSTLKRAEEQREQGALYSAQFEFQAALEFDEENVRANFGLGLTYMERGEPEKAGDIFERVVGLDAAFAPEHKHLFNEFGINLRKSKLNDQAVEYYRRALEMTDNDENLYYNIARAYYERGDRDDCILNLRKALEMRPAFEEAKKFLDYVEKTKE